MIAGSAVMRDYSKVSPRLWTGTLGKGIKGDPHCQALAAYLVTSPHCNMIGLYHLPIAYAASDLGWSEKDLTKALRRVCMSGFAEYDDEAERVWIVEHARHELGSKEDGTMGRGDKRISNIRSILKDHRISFLYNKFLARYGAAFHLDLEPIPKALGKGHGKDLRSPTASQEQEQKQEQEQEKLLAPSSAQRETSEDEGRESNNHKPKQARKADPLWDALMAACRVEGEIPKSARGAYNRARSDLAAVGATPEEIHRRAKVYRQQWPKVSLTPTALARRWAECERPHVSPQRDYQGTVQARRDTEAEASAEILGGD